MTLELKKSFVLLGNQIRDVAMTSLAKSGSNIGQISNRVVTAVRTVDGKIKLNAWEIDDDNNIKNKGSAQLKTLGFATRRGTVTSTTPRSNQLKPQDIALSRYSPTNRVISAALESGGRLLLTVWRLNHEDDKTSIIQKGSATTTDVSRVAIVHLNEDHVLTAVRTSSGKLKFLVWTIGKNGTLTEQAAHTTNHSVWEIALTFSGNLKHPSRGQRIVTAVRDNNTQLKVMVWDIINGTFHRKGEASGGTINGMEIDKKVIPNPTSNAFEITTAVRDAEDQLKLLRWSISVEGDVTQTGKTATDTYAVKDMVLSIAGHFQKITVSTDLDGRLKVSSWGSDNLAPDSKTITKGFGDALSIAQIPGNHRAVIALRNAKTNLELSVWEYFNVVPG